MIKKTILIIGIILTVIWGFSIAELKKKPSSGSSLDTTSLSNRIDELADYFTDYSDSYICGSQIAVTAKPFYAAADLQTAVDDAATDGKRWVKVISKITLSGYLILKNNVNIDADGDTLVCGISDNNVAVVCTVKAAVIIGITGSPGNSGVYTRNVNTNITVFADCVGQSTGGDAYSGSGVYANKGTVTVYGDCSGNYRNGIATNYQGVITVYGNCTSTGASGGYGAQAYGGTIYVTGDCIATGATSCDGVRCSVGAGGGTIVIKGNCTSNSTTAGIGAYSSGGSLTIYGNCTAINSATGIGAECSNASTCTLKIYGGVLSGKEYGLYNSAGYTYLDNCLIKAIDASSPYSAVKLAAASISVFNNCVLTSQHASSKSIYAADSEDVYILGSCLANRAASANVWQWINNITVNDSIPTFP